MRTLQALLISMRPHQWVKNLVFFTALVFGGRLESLHDVAAMLVGFVLFCLLSSAVYLLNDVQDRALDRRHPDKRRRPIASGELRAATAVQASVALTAGALALAFFFPVLDPAVRGFGFGITLVAYYLLNLAYTRFFKEQAILDVLSISIGFILRIMAGGFLIDVAISHWAILCTFFLALFLALAKRRHELYLHPEGEVAHRPVLKEYHPILVDQMLTVVLAATIVAYAIYTMSGRVGETRLYYSLVFVVYGLFRYLYLIHRHDQGGDPTRTLVSDVPILITIGLWGITVLWALYFGG